MAVSTIKRTRKIVSATFTGNSGNGATVYLSDVSSNDLVLDITCTNNTNAICLPWLYDNRMWFAKTLQWQDMTAIKNQDLNLIIKYIPNGRVQ